MKVIKVRHGVIKKITDHLGVDRLTVSFALKGVRDTDLADSIREVAMKEFKGKYEKAK